MSACVYDVTQANQSDSVSEQIADFVSLGFIEGRTRLVYHKSCVTGSYRLEASYALWEEHLQISHPHVPNPPFIEAGAVVVRDVI